MLLLLNTLFSCFFFFCFFVCFVSFNRHYTDVWTIVLVFSVLALCKVRILQFLTEKYSADLLDWILIGSKTLSISPKNKYDVIH